MWHHILTLALLAAIGATEKCGPCNCEKLPPEDDTMEMAPGGLLLNCTGVPAPVGALPSPALAKGAAWLEAALEGAEFVRLEARSCSAERLLVFPALPVPMRTLDLSQNAIAQLGDKVLHAHRNTLADLYMNDNRLEDLNADTLKELSGLRDFRVERNRLKVLPLGALPPELLRLSVAGNAITELQPPAFTAKMQLQELDLSDNALTELPAEAMLALAALPALRTLHLAGNPLRALDGAALTRTLPSLHTLDVARCGLTTLPLGKEHAALRVLDATHNALSKADVVSIARTFPSLQELQLGYNSIAAFPIDTTHASLQVLNLTNNKLTSLPEKLSPFPALMELDLSANSLSEVPERALGSSSLPVLRALWLDRNEPLATLKLIAPMPHLRLLSAEGLTRMRTIEADAFVGLKGDFPSGPGINASAVCAPRQDGSLPGLILRLSKNSQLTDVASDALKGLPVCELYLSEAALTTLSEDLVPWERLRVVDLQQNPWACECELQWLIDRVVTHMYENGNSELLYELRCETPADLRTHRLVHFYEWPKALCNRQQTLQRLMTAEKREYSLSAGNGMLIALVAVGLIFLGTVIAGLTMHYQTLKRKRRQNRRV